MGSGRAGSHRGPPGHPQRASQSFAGIGLAIWNPWAPWQPKAARRSSVAWSSTPSAVATLSRPRASSITERTTASSSLTRHIWETKLLSIFTSSKGSRRNRLSEE